MLQLQFIIFHPTENDHLVVQAGNQGAILTSAFHNAPHPQHPTAHPSSFPFISLILWFSFFLSPFPVTILTDISFLATDYCFNLLKCLPPWGIILVQGPFYNASLPMPLSFKILQWLPTASGRNSHDLSWPGLLNSLHLAACPQQGCSHTGWLRVPRSHGSPASPPAFAFTPEPDMPLPSLPA